MQRLGNLSLEAYKLVQHWAEQLRIDKYFTLIEENEYRSKNSSLKDAQVAEETIPLHLPLPKVDFMAVPLQDGDSSPLLRACYITERKGKLKKGYTPFCKQ